MKALMMFMSSTGTRAAPKPAKFLVLLIKDKGRPGARARTVTVTANQVYGNPSPRKVRRSTGGKHESGRDLTPR